MKSEAYGKIFQFFISLSASFESKDGEIDGEKGMNIKKLLERWQGKDKYDGAERRKYFRLIYPPGKRPRLKVREHELEIIDISEQGMKLLNYMQRNIGKYISGTVELYSGESIDIIGKVVWLYKNELGLLTTRLPQSILIKEVRALLRDKGLSELH